MPAVTVTEPTIMQDSLFPSLAVASASTPTHTMKAMIKFTCKQTRLTSEATVVHKRSTHIQFHQTTHGPGWSERKTTTTG